MRKKYQLQIFQFEFKKIYIQILIVSKSKLYFLLFIKLWKDHISILRYICMGWYHQLFSYESLMYRFIQFSRSFVFCQSCFNLWLHRSKACWRRLRPGLSFIKGVRSAWHLLTNEQIHIYLDHVHLWFLSPSSHKCYHTFFHVITYTGVLYI